MILDEVILREAALQLLASSTIKRYAREAGRLAEQAGLPRRLRDDAEERSRQRSRLLELLQQLEHETERPPAEIEAALLIAAFARAGGDDVAALLHRAQGAASIWIRCLAERYLQLGPPTADELAELEARLAKALIGDVRLGTPLEAADRESPSDFPRAA